MNTGIHDFRNDDNSYMSVDEIVVHLATKIIQDPERVEQIKGYAKQKKGSRPSLSGKFGEHFGLCLFVRNSYGLFEEDNPHMFTVHKFNGEELLYYKDPDNVSWNVLEKLIEHYNKT